MEGAEVERVAKGDSVLLNVFFLHLVLGDELEYFLVHRNKSSIVKTEVVLF